MKKLSEIKQMQHEFIEECRLNAKDYIHSISTDELEIVLLSGSVARGDFMPGKLGGMIDLTVIRKKGSTATPLEIFGEDQEPEIPYHCIQNRGQWFQIAFHNIITESDFSQFDESKKFALLESIPLWTGGGTASLDLDNIRRNLKVELPKKLERALGFIHYYISEYKKDRWIRRGAYSQLHANLDNAINLAIKCLFYINGKYAPAEDRRLYYSYDLPQLPSGYNEMIEQLFNRNIMSYSDYQRRERVFQDKLLPILKE